MENLLHVVSLAVLLAALGWFIGSILGDFKFGKKKKLRYLRGGFVSDFSFKCGRDVERVLWKMGVSGGKELKLILKDSDWDTCSYVYLDNGTTKELLGRVAYLEDYGVHIYGEGGKVSATISENGNFKYLANSTFDANGFAVITQENGKTKAN